MVERLRLWLVDRRVSAVIDQRRAQLLAERERWASLGVEVSERVPGDAEIVEGFRLRQLDPSHEAFGLQAEFLQLMWERASITGPDSYGTASSQEGRFTRR